MLPVPPHSHRIESTLLAFFLRSCKAAQAFIACTCRGLDMGHDRHNPTRTQVAKPNRKSSQAFSHTPILHRRCRSSVSDCGSKPELQNPAPTPATDSRTSSAEGPRSSVCFGVLAIIHGSASFGRMSSGTTAQRRPTGMPSLSSLLSLSLRERRSFRNSCSSRHFTRSMLARLAVGIADANASALALDGKSSRLDCLDCCVMARLTTFVARSGQSSSMALPQLHVA